MQINFYFSLYFFILCIFYTHIKKNRPFATKRTAFSSKRAYLFLFLFKAVAAGTAFRVLRARIAYVDFAKGAIVPRTVVFAFSHTATDASIHFLFVFHHNFKKPPFKVSAVCANSRDIIDIYKNLL